MRRATAALVLLGACAVGAQTPGADFARGAEVRAEGAGSIFRVVLPEEVYATVTRPDLGDIRVLNASGDPVPHTLREAPPAADPAAEWRVVPSFPMTEAQTGRRARTQVRIGADGTVLEVTNNASSGEAITAYLVDASAVKEPLARMALTWATPQDVTFLARLSVDGSNDLDRWHTAVPSAAIAQLRREAFTLTQNEIALPEGTTPTKYLRLSWPKEVAGVTLESVRVRPRTAAAEREVRWRTLGPERVDAARAEYDTRGFVPIEYVDLDFVDATDAAAVTVRARSNPSSEWTPRHTGVFYSLKEADAVIRSRPARVVRTTDRYWAVERSRDGGWRRDRVPRLKVGWHPHELLFLAQGSGPYTLAYGSARVDASDAPVDAVLSSLTEADRTGRVRLATLGPSRSLGGDAALVRPVPRRQVVLWAMLVGAVALLAFIAMRLFRDTARAE